MKKESKRIILISAVTLIFSACSILYSLATSYFISLLYGNTITIYSLTIGSYMLFLGIGAFLYEKFSKYGINMLLYTETALMIVAYFAPLIISWIGAVEISFNFKLSSSFFILGLIGILSGIELPLLMGLAKEKVAIIVGVDYLGGLLGSLLYVFYFLPHINTIDTFHQIAFVNLITTIIFYFSYKMIADEAINYKVIVFMILLGVLMFNFSKKIVKTSEHFFIEKRIQLKVYL